MGWLLKLGMVVWTAMIALLSAAVVFSLTITACVMVISIVRYFLGP